MNSKRSETSLDLMIRRNIKRVVGLNIRRRRLEQGMSEADLGRHLTCADCDVAALEAGEYALEADALFDLAKLLKCRLSDLFTAEPPDWAFESQDQAFTPSVRTLH